MNSPGRVVVGIDGTTEGLRALDVAIDEALRFEHHIELVHIFHEMVPTPLLATYDVLTSREAGRAALDEAVAQLGHRLSDTRGRLTVSTKLIDGSVREELPKLARDARLLVIGRTPLRGLDKVLAGSAAASVCAHSSVPVVSVPISWSESADLPVVVGVVDASSQAALAIAFEQAQARGVRLRVVRAWEAPAAWTYDVPVDPAEVEESWRAAAKEELADGLAGWQRSYPGVRVEHVIAATAPGPALVEASRTAQAVVVTARRNVELLHPKLGSTVRRLLARAQCPVFVIPPHLPRRQSAHEATVVTLAAPEPASPLP
jgi:nucleotide-binding universal stress UspA family protein